MKLKHFVFVKTNLSLSWLINSRLINSVCKICSGLNHSLSQTLLMCYHMPVKYYRLISLLSTFSKIIERIVPNRLLPSAQTANPYHWLSTWFSPRQINNLCYYQPGWIHQRQKRLRTVYLCSILGYLGTTYSWIPILGARPLNT